MQKYTANYALTNPNFVFQNLVTNEHEFPERPLLYVLKNILQRGRITKMSKFLQERLGEIHQDDSFKKHLLLIGSDSPKWISTIKGDDQNQYFPARDFLEKIIPEYFGDFAFIDRLILPEIEINEITDEYNSSFINQQVDFYLPQAKLIIEIDGQQHKTDDVTRVSDIQRDNYLSSKGFTTIRISTQELRNHTFQDKVDKILEHLTRSGKSLAFYKEAYEKILLDKISDEEYQTKLRPTAIIRFQILLIDLLLNNYLNFDEEWKINLIVDEEEMLDEFAHLAVEDFFIWFEHLHYLKEKKSCTRPNCIINYVYSTEDYKIDSQFINIDFSLFKRWTDENELYPDLLYVRTDYFGGNRNYFKVSCAQPIDYKITEDDKLFLEFFLKNIFGKDNFREGQFPIIAGVLNREDTIGLLPTGGGKSLCYQLPCLLQPSIHFVVCPIKSLMYDQHDNMKDAFISNTGFITSDLDATEKTKVQRDFADGKYLFVWISPERFQIKKFREYISEVNAKAPIAYAVIDEVHCLSEWGHDFRTSYLNLSKTIQRFCPSAKFVGLTATASVNVLKDIKVEFARNGRQLQDENIKSLLDYSREELEFEVIRDGNNKYKTIKGLIEKEGIAHQTGKAALVFTPHVNGPYGCYEVSNRLKGMVNGKANFYSGQVPMIKERDEQGKLTGRKLPVMKEKDFNEYKKQVQLDFKKDKYTLLAATKAFGMGIDKQNIHYTFHYGIPSSVEALYQEAGRAGRWDKRVESMKDVKAKCYVLYTPETTDPENVERLFEVDTTFAEIKEINEEVKWEGKDIFRQIFLFLQGQQDIVEEVKVIQLLLDNYFKPSSRQLIYYNTIIQELRGIGFSGAKDRLVQLAQKGIYRLSLLGIVRDWTTDFVTHYEVEFVSTDESHIKKSLLGFLSKYQPDIDLEKELEAINRPSVTEKCIWHLLQWTFNNIAYSRKQTLKTLSDWCNDFSEIGNEAFKERIDNYFRFTDTTFIFQHIAENPKAYSKWFEVFYFTERDENNEDVKTFIPAIEDGDRRLSELGRLRDGLSRFLESYKNSMGLNVVSGMIRLFLNDYEDTDGRKRLEGGLESIIETFDKNEQQHILEKLTDLGKYLDDDGKEKLCMSIVKYFPYELERIAALYNLFYLLDDSISQKVKQLKKLNKQLYGQFEQISKV